MSAKEHVISEAMKLSEAERLQIAEALYHSLEGPADPQAQQDWAEEIARRISNLDAGRAKVVPWEEARKQIAGNDATDATAPD